MLLVAVAHGLGDGELAVIPVTNCRGGPFPGTRIGYSAMAVMFFLIPTGLAYLGRLVPFPGLFATVGNLEQRAKIVAVVVAGCMTFLMLHLVLYPYPSIIPWFVDLKNLHDYCGDHARELVCASK